MQGDTLTILATAFLLLGLAFTTIGAAIAARAVIITESQATEIAGTAWDVNEELKAALLNQSRKAKLGLIFITIGTVLQMAGTIPPTLITKLVTTTPQPFAVRTRANDTQVYP
jgi:hypothetical protein